MPFDFVLPDLGEGMTEAEIRKWLVKEGDAIEEHQTILEIETDKAVVEVPSPKKGRALKINKGEGEIVRVGEVLMTIAEEGEAIEEKPRAEEKPKERPKSVSVVGVLPEEEEEILATPAVRAYAKEQGVDLAAMKGTGPGGSITKEDVMAVSRKTPKAEDVYGPVERVSLRGLRRTIAKNLALSQKMTAFVTGMDDADVTDLWDLREKEKKALLDKGIHITFMPFFIKAVYHALLEYPMLNASVDDEREEIILKKYYNIGVAVHTPEGLMVPVIRNAVQKTILELAQELQELTQKAKDRKIKIEDLRGSTFTITNYGSVGSTYGTPIINYPDTAILGTGKIAERPWVKNGQIVIRRILPLSLTFDHRVADGVDATKFLNKLRGYLEDPALLFIESA